MATNDMLDLTRREADLGLRVSRTPGDTLKGLRLTAQHTAAYATPDWAARIAADPSAPVDWIVYKTVNTLPDEVLARTPNARIRYRFDDMIAMAGAAREGLGAVRLPMFLGRATTELIQLDVLDPQPYADVWLVGHADVWPSAKVAALREAIRAHFRATQHRFVA